MKTKDEITLWLGATRYYMGRMTYAVGDFCDLLIEHWPSLNDATRQIIKRDIETEFARDDDLRQQKSEYLPLGHDCDREQWGRVRKLWKEQAPTGSCLSDSVGKRQECVESIGHLKEQKV